MSPKPRRLPKSRCVLSSTWQPTGVLRKFERYNVDDLRTLTFIISKGV